MRRWIICVSAILIFFLGGCNLSAPDQGIIVMFEGLPNLYTDTVYYNGVAIGQITSQEEQSAVAKVTISLAPEFEKQAGQHMAFYAAGGSLIAAKLHNFGKPLASGDKLCGFTSKAAFNWFKFKTLLNDRVAKAIQQAEELYSRFG